MCASLCAYHLCRVLPCCLFCSRLCPLLNPSRAVTPLQCTAPGHPVYVFSCVTIPGLIYYCALMYKPAI